MLHYNRQLLPKDILDNARMISGEEAEKQIRDAVAKQSTRHVPYRKIYGTLANPLIGTTTASASAWAVQQQLNTASTTGWGTLEWRS